MKIKNLMAAVGFAVAASLAITPARAEDEWSYTEEVTQDEWNEFYAEQDRLKDEGYDFLDLWHNGDATFYVYAKYLECTEETVNPTVIVVAIAPGEQKQIGITKDYNSWCS